MLNKVEEFNFGQAKYIVLKELDTFGPIAKELLAKDLRNLNVEMMEICDRIELIQTWDKQGALPTSYHIEDRHFYCFISLGEVLPSLVLLRSELNWNTFIGGLLIIADEYCKCYAELTNIVFEEESKKETSNEMPCIEDNINRLQDIKNSFDAIKVLLEIGVGYTELLKASFDIARELKTWRNSNPASIRLSQSYLKALDFIDDKY